MTLEELKAAGSKAIAIEAAMERLKKAEENLALLTKSLASNDFSIQSSWKPSLILKKGEKGYYNNNPDITVRVEIPFGVVQQQLVNAVAAARRAVIALGGTA